MSFADDLTTIRDNMVAELKGETARRAALVAAGNPAPTTYSVSGKSMSWNEYMSTMLKNIKDTNETLVQVGGDGGLYEVIVEGYTV